MKKFIAKLFNELTLRRASRWKWFRRWVGGKWEKRQAKAWIDGMVPVIYTYWAPADVVEESLYSVIYTENHEAFPKATVKELGP